MPTFRNTVSFISVGSVKMEQSVPKCQHIKFIRRGIAQVNNTKKNILLAEINQVTLNCPLATDWTVRDRTPVGARDILFSMPAQTSAGAHPVTFIMSLGFLLGRRFNHPRPSSAEVQNDWRDSLTPYLRILWHVKGRHFALCLESSISCVQNMTLALRTACFGRWSLVYWQQ